MYESFWHGFSAAHDLFTGGPRRSALLDLADISPVVIDVGKGKEASDAKIKGSDKPQAQEPVMKSLSEYLKLYAKNAQCEMIVLGASHDNGYATVLSSFVRLLSAVLID